MVILNIGISGFPYTNTAPVHKCIYINKILVSAGFNALVLNSEPILLQSSELNISSSGFFENIEYQTTYIAKIKKSSKIIHKIFRWGSWFSELFSILKLNRKQKINITFLFTNGSFIKLIYYRLLSKILGFKLVIIYHEFRSDFDYRKERPLLRINDRLFDNYFPYFVDAVLPISEFLICHVRKISPGKPYFKIPPLIDFSLFDKSRIEIESYFLYCGSAGYFDVIEFIIESFEKTMDGSEHFLYLVTNGNSKQLQKINDVINKKFKRNKIKIFSELNFDDLITLYINAKALLIPLKPDIRDAARFPQKIAEYVASGTPIVSTNFGEVKYYFNDESTALIAEKYDVNMFSEKLNFVIQHPNKALEIGKAGKLLGFNLFNYSNYVESLSSFINKIVNSSKN